MKYGITIENKRIIVTPEIKGINDFRKFNFILDTGASKSIIDEIAVKRLGYELHRLKVGDRLSTAGGGVRSKIVELPELTLFGAKMVNFEVNVIKLPYQILYYADGLIGMDFLLQFQAVRFDFVQKFIEIEG